MLMIDYIRASELKHRDDKIKENFVFGCMDEYKGIPGEMHVRDIDLSKDVMDNIMRTVNIQWF